MKRSELSFFHELKLAIIKLIYKNLLLFLKVLIRWKLKLAYERNLVFLFIYFFLFSSSVSIFSSNGCHYRHLYL